MGFRVGSGWVQGWFGVGLGWVRVGLGGFGVGSGLV